MQKHLETRRILIVAGEASGDAHAAKLVDAMRVAAPHVDFEFFGATGAKMRAVGVETVVAADDFAIVGLPEIARALPMFWRAFKKLKKESARRSPDAAILVDFPDFNLKLAKSLSKQGVKVVYYISPQLWAWRKYRVETVRRYVDLLLTILPFEKSWYAKEGVENVEYVGNPTAHQVAAKLTKAEFCRKHGLDETKPIIALLPGSRHKEIARILPVLLETAALMNRQIRAGNGLNQTNQLQFVVALAATRKMAEVEAAIAELNAKNIRPPDSLIVAHDETHEVLGASDAAAVTSGTATLETGIIGTPLVVVYQGSALNYALLRPLINVEHFGLVNLIAEKRLAAELIQKDFTAQALAAELFRLLEPETNREMRRELAKVVEKLGDGGASQRAAEAILRLLNKR